MILLRLIFFPFWLLFLLAFGLFLVIFYGLVWIVTGGPWAITEKYPDWSEGIHF